LHVERQNKNFLLAVNLLSQVAAHKKAGTYFKDEENIFLANLVQNNQEWIYNPTNVSNTITQIGIPKIYFLLEKKNSKTLISIAAKLASRNPIVTLRQILDMSSLLFYPGNLKGGLEPPSHLGLTADGTKVVTNNVTATPSDSKFPQKTFFPTVDVSLVKLLDAFRQLPLASSLFFHFYFFIFLAFLSCVLQRSTKDMIILFPTFLLVLFLVPILGSNEFRYYYPIYLTTQIFSSFLIMKIFFFTRKKYFHKPIKV
jgi:hypothetical protein